jgi:hypothetical protein
MVGGILGGLTFLALAVCPTLLYCRRRRHNSNIAGQKGEILPFTDLHPDPAIFNRTRRTQGQQTPRSFSIVGFLADTATIVEKSRSVSTNLNMGIGGGIQDNQESHQPSCDTNNNPFVGEPPSTTLHQQLEAREAPSLIHSENNSELPPDYVSERGGGEGRWSILSQRFNNMPIAT